MPDRTYPVPARLASAFNVDAGTGVRERTLRRVARSTDDSEAREWASRVVRRIDAGPTAVLAAAGVPEMAGCRYYGLLDPDHDDQVIFAVVRDDPVEQSTSAFTKWTGDSWEVVASGYEPEGIDYVELDGDLLADALESVSSGGAGLLLRATDPKGWLRKAADVLPFETVTASAGSKEMVFAIVDDYDTTAVLDAIRVTPGPKAERRVGGEWKVDTSILSRLRSVDPPAVVQIPPEQVDAILEQVDEYDADADPITAAAEPSAGIGVMVAVRPSSELAAELAVPDGSPPGDLHVTLAYLGDADELGADIEDLAEALQDVGDGNLQGTIGGIGQFPPGDLGTPVYVPVDVPGLNALYERIQAALAATHVADKVRRDHGFTPHLTLGYDVDTDPVPPKPIEFGSISIVVGPDEIEIPLGAVAASGLPKTQKCEYCKERATKRILHAEGMAYIPVCDKHLEKGKDDAELSTPDGTRDPSNINRIDEITASGEFDESEFSRDDGKFANKGTVDTDDAPADGDGEVDAAEIAPPVSETDESPTTAPEDAEAADSDAAFDILIAQEALAETQRRDAFNADARDRWEQAQDDPDARAAVTAELKAERARRSGFDRDRRYKVEAERIRRLERSRDLARTRTGLAAAGTNPPATTRMPGGLVGYWAKGKGAVKIRWGTGGDFNRCRKQLAKYLRPDQVAGACANIHKIATGRWPGRNRRH